MPAVSGFIVLLLVVGSSVSGSVGVACDADGDCFYVPPAVVGESRPALVVLHCDGAGWGDLDSFRLICDSLDGVVATCHASRNRRGLTLNDSAVTATARKLLAGYDVDSSRVFVFGYSGQGIQALAALFLHPDLYRGAVSVCGHRGSLGLAVFELLADRYVYLVTRVADWNRAENEMLAEVLVANGVPTRLVTTSGEHQPGSCAELLDACRWLAAQSD